MVSRRFYGGYWYLGFAFIALLNPYPIDQDANAETHPPVSQNSAEENTQPTDLSVVENKLDAIASAIETAQADPEAQAKEQRAQDDLDAQKSMAQWAFWMFIAAAVTTGLTGVGIFLIWRTLAHTKRAAKYAGVAARQARKATVTSELMVQETITATMAAAEAVKVGREANELAVNTANQQLMPYVYIDELEPFDFMSPADHIQVVLKNYGQTPATNLVVKGDYRRCKKGQAVLGKADLRKGRKSRDIPPQGMRTVNIDLMLGDHLQGTVKQIVRGNLVIVINLRYSYKGLGTSTLYRQDIIILDKNGFREPAPNDNMEREK